MKSLGKGLLWRMWVCYLSFFGCTASNMVIGSFIVALTTYGAIMAPVGFSIFYIVVFAGYMVRNYLMVARYYDSVISGWESVGHSCYSTEKMVEMLEKPKDHTYEIHKGYELSRSV